MYRPPARRDREPMRLVAVLMIALALLAFGVVGVSCYLLYFQG